jgi:hypothetical protein
MNGGRDAGRVATIWLALTLALGVLWPTVAAAADPVAVLTEIRPGKGEVRQRRPTRTDRSGRSRPSVGRSDSRDR